MIEFVVPFMVVALLCFMTAAAARRYPAAMRPWLWVALFEYLAGGAAQIAQLRIFGGDANYYRESGMRLAAFLDSSFTWAVPETVSLLFHQPSAFDSVVLGAGTNTGSMSAAAAWIMFVTRSSEFGAQALVAGFSMRASLACFDAFKDACPEANSRRLFIATVLFPAVAFWTSALHKEAFCLMGMGFLCAAWRAARHLRLRAVPYAVVGTLLTVLFRAPALPPMLLGFVAYLVLDRVRKAKGAEVALVAPAYLLVGAAVLTIGMILVTRVSPNLALDKLGESVALQQSRWAGVTGGSSFNRPVAHGLGEQLVMAPLGLINALFRPQLFDVTNALVLVSALQMTVVTFMVYRAIRMHGFYGLMRKLQSSPFLLMCAVVTIVGCTFVGLATLNFGSLARYRAPFLPFYGALLAVLTQRQGAGYPVERGRLTQGVGKRAGAKVPPIDGRRLRRERGA